MATLIAGVLTFSLVHLLPAAAPTVRAGIKARVGAQAYRGLFSLLVGAGLVLIVFGWSAANPAFVYRPPLPAGALTALLMLAAFILLVAAQFPTNTRRILRHPMLLGVLVWSSVHLLANGDSRSLVLFGGLGAWSIAEILLCNRRDTGWARPAAVPIRNDLLAAVLGLIAFAATAYWHGWLFGVKVIPAV